MDLKEAKNKRIEVIKNLLKNKLALALGELSQIVYIARDGNLIAEFENLESTYKNVLKYTFGYAKDPERDRILNDLKRKLIELSDDAYSVIADRQGDWLAAQRKANQGFLKLGEKEKSAIIDGMGFDKEFTGLLKELEPGTTNTEAAEKYGENLEKVFDILWLTNNYREGERLLVNKLMGAKHIPVYDKSLIVSAITISIINHFDLVKAELLFDIYEKAEEQTSQRALVGLFLVFILFGNRLSLYPAIINRIKANTDPRGFAKRMEQVVFQFVRAQETEKVTEKIQKEIIPEVIKLKPNIEEKLKLDELLSADSLEDKNPDWEEFFSDTPDVYKKLEEFSLMQMDGSDVFMGAFSMLKRFGFFEKIGNWFLPFYKEHEELNKSIQSVEGDFNWQKFFEGIEDAPVMCNSDKYSFCFNIGFMPDMQKNMMLEMFNMELEQMKEVSKDEALHNSQAKDKVYYTQYIQDLYRFFNLHPNKASFENVFNLSFDLLENQVLGFIFEDPNRRQVAEFYFKNNYFAEAASIFKSLYNKNKEFELIEKLGFCFQKLGNFSKAIEYYKEAEILDSNRSWLHKKLGYCYRATGNFDEAITYYKKVEDTEKENLEVQVLLGQLHLNKEEYEKALGYYFKVEYLKPDLVKVQRPIAWCSFLLGKEEQAIRYLKKVSEQEGQRSDFLNLGHCHWATGDMKSAISSYQRALKQSGGDTNWFASALLSDSVYLGKYGVDNLEINLMVDFITLFKD